MLLSSHPVSIPVPSACQAIYVHPKARQHLLNTGTANECQGVDSLSKMHMSLPAAKGLCFQGAAASAAPGTCCCWRQRCRAQTRQLPGGLASHEPVAAQLVAAHAVCASLHNIFVFMPVKALEQGVQKRLRRDQSAHIPFAQPLSTSVAYSYKKMQGNEVPR